MKYIIILFLFGIIIYGCNTGSNLENNTPLIDDGLYTDSTLGNNPQGILYFNSDSNTYVDSISIPKYVNAELVGDTIKYYYTEINIKNHIWFDKKVYLPVFILLTGEIKTY